MNKHGPYVVDLDLLHQELCRQAQVRATSPSRLAAQAGVDAAIVTRLKQGKQGDMSASTILNLAMVLNLDPRLFLVRRTPAHEAIAA